MGNHVLLVLALALAGGCSKDPGTNNNNNSREDAGDAADMARSDTTTVPDWGTGLSYHGDIEPLIQDNCMPCHAPGDIGPYDLTDFDTVVELAPLIKQAIQSRSMPPYGVDNSGSCNTYKDARWLTDTEIATLVEWLDGDHALGNPEWAPEPFTPAPPLPRVDATLDIGVDYVPMNAPDDYRCFIVDPGLTENQFITGFHVKPGNVETVHHVVLWDMVDQANVDFVEALDAADPGPGYECFGGPGTAGFNLYAAWAPGTPPTVFPEPTGLSLPAGRKVVLQVHYNTAAGSGPDRTTVDLMLADTVGSQTLQVLFANIEMALPGGGAEAEAVFDIQPRQLGAPLAIAIHGVFPHMHTKGTSMTVTHITEDGATCAVNVPSWDFNWQQMYFFEQPLLLQPDDLLRLSCKYDVSADTGTVPWGEGTGDEMCVAAFYATVGAFPGAVRPVEVGDPIDTPTSVPDVSGADHVWSKRWGGTGYDALAQLTLDDQGNLWAAGAITGGMVDVDGIMLNASNREPLLAKYGPDDTLLWARTYPSSGSNQWDSVAPDGQGGVFIGGDYSGSSWDLAGTVHPATPSAKNDAVIARLDANGDVLWSRSFGGDGLDWIGWDSGDVDSAGNFIVNARIEGVADVLGTQIGTADQITKVLIKMDPDGNLLWANAICSSDRDCDFRLAVGPNDDIVLAGPLQGTSQLHGGSEHVTIGLADEGLVDLEDAFLMGVGSDGSFQWVKTFGGELPDGFSAPRFDDAGNLFVVGWMTGAVDLGSGPVDFSGSSDAVVAEFDPSNGDLLWSKSFGGIGTDRAGSLAFDAAGNLVVSISFEAWADFGGGMLVSEGREDIALVSLTPTGEFRWAKSIGGRGAERWERMETNATSVYLAMGSSYPLTIAGEELTGRGADDVVLTKFTLP